MAKNLWSKTRPVDNPYVTFTVGAFEYSVLKAYQSRKNEKTNKYARLFLCVKSDMTGPHGDMGDTYIAEIPRHPDFMKALEEREKAEEAT